MTVFPFLSPLSFFQAWVHSCYSSAALIRATVISSLHFYNSFLTGIPDANPVPSGLVPTKWSY